MQPHNKKILVFGVFDILHEGHRFFLNKAKALGSELFVVVASDQSVIELKNHNPVHTEDERIKNLKQEKIAEEIIVGDKKHGEWSAIKQINPDIIALGYDQTKLKEVLEQYIGDNKLNIKLVTIGPSDKPHIHSSSLR